MNEIELDASFIMNRNIIVTALIVTCKSITVLFHSRKARVE